jgi:hypothetical protein
MEIQTDPQITTNKRTTFGTCDVTSLHCLSEKLQWCKLRYSFQISSFGRSCVDRGIAAKTAALSRSGKGNHSLVHMGSGTEPKYHTACQTPVRFMISPSHDHLLHIISVTISNIHGFDTWRGRVLLLPLFCFPTSITKKKTSLCGIIMPLLTIVRTSGRLHSEFVRLLFLQAHRETERFFAGSGVQLPQTQRAVFLPQIKGKVDITLTKSTGFRINLNIDGVPITSRTHTHPSYSQTCRLLISSV